MFPVGIVGILRFFFGVQRRCGVDVSAVDTSDLPGPARPLPFDLTLASRTSLPRLPVRESVSDPDEGTRYGRDPAPRPRERLRSHDTHMSQK